MATAKNRFDLTKAFDLARMSFPLVLVGLGSVA
jgi:hypothetical protein